MKAERILELQLHCMEREERQNTPKNYLEAPLEAALSHLGILVLQLRHPAPSPEYGVIT